MSLVRATLLPYGINLYLIPLNMVSMFEEKETDDYFNVEYFEKYKIEDLEIWIKEQINKNDN